MSHFKIHSVVILTIILSCLSFSFSTLSSDELNKESSDATMIQPFDAEPFNLPEELEEQLYNYRSDWSRLTGFEFSQLHWRHFIVIYMNKNADVYKNNNLLFMRQWSDEFDEEDIEKLGYKYKKYPIGTIILKENYHLSNGRPGKPSLSTIMIKREEQYDPEFGDWEYVQTTADGEVSFRGNSQNVVVNASCVSCHANVKERDFVFSNIFTQYSLE